MAPGGQPQRRMAGTDAPDASDVKARGGRWGDWSLSAVAAGFLAMSVSFSGPLAIFYQAGAGLALLATGLSASFERIMAHLPKGIASGTMAGILHGPFGRTP